MRVPKRLLLVVLAAGAALIATQACTLDRGGSHEAAVGGSSQGGAGSGAQGGAPECEQPGDCLGAFTDCHLPTCMAGACGARDVDADTPCAFDGGEVCDGAGNCVRRNGAACAQDEQCASENCVDDVCCATPCDSFCSACNVLFSEGICTSHPAGSDPDLECSAGAGVCDGGSACVDGSPDYVKQFGDAGTFQQGWSMAVDTGNNVLLTGHFDGQVDFSGMNPLTSNGGTDVFVAKLDAMGDRLWSRQFGGAGDQLGYGIATDSGQNVFVVGTFDNTIDILGTVHNGNAQDVYLAKLDPSGNRLWSFAWGDSAADFGYRVATDSMGNVVVFGSFEGNITLTQQHTSAGGLDLFVAKLDPAGSLLWSKRFGDTGIENAFDLAIDSTGAVVLVGGFEDTVDFGGNLLTSAGAFDVYVAKLDAAGNHLWSANYGDTKEDGARGVDIDANDNSIVLTGTFDDSIDFGGGMLVPINGADAFVARLDANGAHLASTLIGGANIEEGKDVTVDANGNVSVVGHYRNGIELGGTTYGANGDEGFVVKMTSQLNHLWSYAYQGAGNDVVNAVASDSLGGVLTFGYFVQDLDVGTGALTSAGGQDVFLARYLP